ncbi:hypothetical protein LTR36_006681 [Oleoguttula mirabilis]|uniref:F-box domain-containing protein n=1 Tax=Oleoguttula mirabilis TaxID=1507867 RepID=A0AAV9JCH2_9PEZI|nr:hypothetical protein LTR36_006681 [Oleoguttula mirabilis]
MSPPVDQVFETPELLEMILLHLPPHGSGNAAKEKRMKRLNNACLVNKGFKDTICNSIRLQRARFLAHSPTLELDPDGYPVFNPHLEKLMRKMGAEIWHYTYDDSKDPGHMTLHVNRPRQYESEDGYEYLEHSDEDSWRQLKITASKVELQVQFTRKDQQGPEPFEHNRRDYRLSSEPGDFGALFDLLNHAGGICFFEQHGLEGECPLHSAFKWHFDPTA